VIFAIQNEPIPPESLHVDVVGHQFWWEFRYPGFATANELHVPVSTPHAVRMTSLKVLSADVDHSFWVPALFGKIDTVPNQTNSLWFNPDKVGIYLGQCAQFCGTAHAQMLLRIYVQSEEDYQSWLKNQQAPAVDDPSVAEGRHVFESQACMNCHTIRGTPAHGRFGPDLTHLMSRETLASGIVVNSPENLRRWIKDPDSIKPGCLMPAMQLSDPQIDEITAYLETLK
jgi:cytochrome c oxidase subunit 2